MLDNPFNYLEIPVAKRLAVKWAQGVLELPEFYILDAETTGVKADKDAFVQISTIHHPTMTISNWWVNPEQPIELAAIKVHGRTSAMAEKHPNFTHAYKHIARRINGKPLIVYNLGFDLTMLQSQAKRYGLPEFTPSPAMDAMIYAGLSWGRRVWRDGAYYYQNPKLTAWAKYMQIPDTSNAHDARADVLYTYEAILKLARMVVDG